ncbi:pilus assembly FimT family protein [Hydrogenimonas urashimensis]|uniref:pilus assembly FimT family protein n=1 Tax=Hydrogenimonas urashimensis TaxID=2740515 RepID=UPI0019156561|nr:type II secretion system protein [Hydrogenimonas urashimensis]
MKAIRHAFTMIELIMVILIFGIIAMIGADIFVKIYDNYIIARTMNTLQTKTELALEQIARRLQYRIKDSTIARKDSNLSQYKFLGDADESYHILEWIGYADEALKGEWNGTMNVPGWSGFIDLDDSNKTHVATPGSHLSYADNIIKTLSNNTISLATAASAPAIVMDGHVGDYKVSSYGWHPHADHNYTFPVTKQDETTLNFVDGTTSKEIYEHYKMAWTAYALVPSCPSGVTDDCNLSLYYNYQPWYAERFDQDANSSLLMEHVSTFKFIQMGDSIRLKLCVGEHFYDKNISFCKEKVVF